MTFDFLAICFCGATIFMQSPCDNKMMNIPSIFRAPRCFILTILVLLISNSRLDAGAVALDENGFRVHRVNSSFQAGETEIRVLLPDDFDEDESYRILYVLPVLEKDNRKYADGLLEVKKYGFHNTYKLVCVAPEFTEKPWFADHEGNPQMRDESYFLKVVLPLIEEEYPVMPKKEGRLLIGFSKSGWGAFSLLLRNPEVFHRAAGWDTGIRVDTGPIEEADRSDRISRIFGSRENFERYRISTLIKERGKALGDEARIFYYNTEGVRAIGGEIIHRLMVEQEIPHRYLFEPKRPHRWDSGWIPQAVAFLVGD